MLIESMLIELMLIEPDGKSDQGLIWYDISIIYDDGDAFDDDYSYKLLLIKLMLIELMLIQLMLIKPDDWIDAFQTWW